MLSHPRNVVGCTGSTGVDWQDSNRISSMNGQLRFVEYRHKLMLKAALRGSYDDVALRSQRHSFRSDDCRVDVGRLVIRDWPHFESAQHLLRNRVRMSRLSMGYSVPAARRWYAGRSRSTSAFPPRTAPGTGSWRSSRSGSTDRVGGRGGSGGGGSQKRSAPAPSQVRPASASCGAGDGGGLRAGHRPTLPGSALRSSRSRLEQRLPIAAAPAQDQERVGVERLGQQVERRREVLARHLPVRAAAALVEIADACAGTAARRRRRRSPRARAAPRRPAASRWAAPARPGRSRPWPRRARRTAASPIVTWYGRGARALHRARAPARARPPAR